LKDIGYQVVHAIAGRIRIRIPWLETDADAVGKFQRLLESLNFVSDIRVNPLAQSIVITYRADAISSQEAVNQFVNAMQQVKPTPMATTTQSSQPQGEAVVQMAQTVAQTVAQTIQLVVQTASAAGQQSASDRQETATNPSPQSPPSQSVASKSVVSEMPSPWDDPDSTELPVTVETSTPSTPAATPVTVAEPEQIANPSVQPELWLHSTVSLAKRLNVNSQTITRRRNRSDFSVWTQMQDPEGIAWSYDTSSQSFYPFTPFASPLEQMLVEPMSPSTGAATIETEEVIGKVVG
jgi:hypothetical protein